MPRLLHYVTHRGEAPSLGLAFGLGPANGFLRGTPRKSHHILNYPWVTHGYIYIYQAYGVHRGVFHAGVQSTVYWTKDYPGLGNLSKANLDSSVVNPFTFGVVDRTSIRTSLQTNQFLTSSPRVSLSTFRSGSSGSATELTRPTFGLTVPPSRGEGVFYKDYPELCI